MLTQDDVSQLSDDDLKRQAVQLRTLAADPANRKLAGVFRKLAFEMVRLVKERRTSWLYFEAELMNDDGPGAIVGPDDDPIGDAVREMRALGAEVGLD